MVTKPKSEPKLTDEERHQRFKDMAREIEASEKPEDFDRAFDIIMHKQEPKARHGS